MFQNISHKIIICSYLFFFGNIIRICYKEIEHVTQLENSLSISSVMILNIIQNCFQIFLVSLMIYGIGYLFGCFEKIHYHDNISKYEK
ncbi:MAG: hypothetical protein UFX20_04940 [Longibaculum muris]|uniref:Uncharacterized protein n=1 Tax=Longibaculum muris TaxID=1796628 RepID=A0A4R3Z9M4_9FIRM|nr:hypothetical protein [Longibaculum muris]KXU45287.1 hypothetical protein HMPREF3037_02390 [Candidatus Stoquefichus sp. KLE1796]MBS5369814.1 hypothetical protein [Coprobacillus cateniformis]MCR1886505.1 hypothetical protein [Longibaculum muris]MED9811430.1 hypothetical protein [Longibaculum muris]TCW01557.1 hypothetical protein EDD60_1038 [Longibaculum muris]